MTQTLDKVDHFFERVDKHLPTLANDAARRAFLTQQAARWEQLTADFERDVCAGRTTTPPDANSYDFTLTLLGLHERLGKLQELEHA